MRNNARFWDRQGYDERQAFKKALSEVKEMVADPESPCGEKLDVATKEKFVRYRMQDLGLI